MVDLQPSAAAGDQRTDRDLQTAVGGGDGEADLGGARSGLGMGRDGIGDEMQIGEPVDREAGPGGGRPGDAPKGAANSDTGASVTTASPDRLTSGLRGSCARHASASSS